MAYRDVSGAAMRAGRTPILRPGRQASVPSTRRGVDAGAGIPIPDYSQMQTPPMQSMTGATLPGPSMQDLGTPTPEAPDYQGAREAALATLRSGPGTTDAQAWSGAGPDEQQAQAPASVPPTAGMPLTGRPFPGAIGGGPFVAPTTRDAPDEFAANYQKAFHTFLGQYQTASPRAVELAQEAAQKYAVEQASGKRETAEGKQEIARQGLELKEGDAESKASLRTAQGELAHDRAANLRMMTENMPAEIKARAQRATAQAAELAQRGKMDEANALLADTRAELEPLIAESQSQRREGQTSQGEQKVQISDRLAGIKAELAAQGIHSQRLEDALKQAKESEQYQPSMYERFAGQPMLPLTPEEKTRRQIAERPLKEDGTPSAITYQNPPTPAPGIKTSQHQVFMEAAARARNRNAARGAPGAAQRGQQQAPDTSPEVPLPPAGGEMIPPPTGSARLAGGEKVIQDQGAAIPAIAKRVGVDEATVRETIQVSQDPSDPKRQAKALKYLKLWKVM